MKSPNRRYGNRLEFAYYVQGVPIPAVARMLMRDQRTIKNWLTGRRRVPYWVPELLRLRNESEIAVVHAMTGALSARRRARGTVQLGDRTPAPLATAGNESFWQDDDAA